jgi:hypothetical protein
MQFSYFFGKEVLISSSLALGLLSSPLRAVAFTFGCPTPCVLIDQDGANFPRLDMLLINGWTLLVLEVSLREEEWLKSPFQSKQSLRRRHSPDRMTLLFSTPPLRIEQLMLFRVNAIST